LIEPQRDPVQVRLREAREICSPREILSQQAIGVLVAAALPRTAWQGHDAADLKRLHKYMLEIEHIDHISDEMRAVVEELWPELALFNDAKLVRSRCVPLASLA
jgi:hypothetical protein